MSSYGFLQTATQLAQLDVTSRQLAQLSELNAHFYAQREAAALHANLSQALFETERMAKRVALTLPEDPFAAAILSHDWLKLVAGIYSTHFVSVEHKRAWADSHGTLTSAYQRAHSDPETASLLGRYSQQRERLNELLLLLDGDPNAFLRASQYRLQTAYNKKSARLASIRRGGITAVALLLLSLLAGLKKMDSLGPFLFFLMILALGYVVFKAFAWISAAAGIGAAKGRYRADMKHLEVYTDFFGDPNAGGFLQKIWNEHPLLFNEPVPTGPTTSFFENRASSVPVQTFVERQIVERQVVVTRCRFCNQMTPVDRPECQLCGAPGFGG